MTKTRSQDILNLGRRRVLGWPLGVGAAVIPAGSLAATEMTSPDRPAGVSTIDGRVPMIDVRSYGAVGDGKADDTAALLRAIAVAEQHVGSAETSGEVILPVGVFIISKQITIPNKVKLIGVGSRSSIIRASESFPARTALIRIGSTGNVFDASIERLQVDCARRPGSTGVYSGYLNEQCGVYNCVILNFQEYGIKLDTSIGGGAEIYRSEIYGSPSGFTAGIYCSTTSATLSVHETDIAGSIGHVNGKYAIYMEDGHLTCTSCHFETVDTGIYVDTNATAVLSGITGHRSIANLVHIASTSAGNVTSLGVKPLGSANCLRDDRTLRTIPGTVQLGFYAMGSRNGSGGAADRFVITDHVGAQGWWNVRTAIAQYQVDAFGNGDSTPSVSEGNVFRTQNSTGTVITDLVDGKQGQRVRIVFGDSHTQMAGRHFSLQGEFRSVENSTIELVYVGTTWVEICRTRSRESYQYTIDDFQETRRLNPQSATLAQLAHTLSTVISDLQARGILQS